MENLSHYLNQASRKYNSNQAHLQECKDTVAIALNKLANLTEYAHFGCFNGTPQIEYYAFFGGSEISRPIRPTIFINSPGDFLFLCDELVKNFKKPISRWTNEEIGLANAVVYTAIMSVACCYDIWQKGSRKTPGTFFEVFMAALLQEMLPDESFSKHIPLAEMLGDDSIETPDDPDEDEEGNASSVSTDLVIKSDRIRKGLVIPLKITTRERIVQPFAHQRILNSAFPGAYSSFVVCISETQQDKRKRVVKHVCVPGTIKLFQRYLAQIEGIYYCDIPPRYNTIGMQRVVPVKSVGHLFIDVYNFFRGL